jgi:hypothetical protein
MGINGKWQSITTTTNNGTVFSLDRWCVSLVDDDRKKDESEGIEKKGGSQNNKDATFNQPTNASLFLMRARSQTNTCCACWSVCSMR